MSQVCASGDLKRESIRGYFTPGIFRLPALRSPPAKPALAASVDSAKGRLAIQGGQRPFFQMTMM